MVAGKRREERRDPRRSNSGLVRMTTLMRLFSGHAPPRLAADRGCAGDRLWRRRGPGLGRSPTTPLVTAVSPNGGTTLGGTTITVTGENFAAGVQVSVGGAAATNVIVLSSTSLSATTATRAAGTVEVTVTLKGRAGTLPGAFTYVAPSQITNEPPVIHSVTAHGVRPKEPGNFADLTEKSRSLPPSPTRKPRRPTGLRVVWHGREVHRHGAVSDLARAASGSTPFVANLKLTIVDRFQTTDGNGLPITFEHRVEQTFTVRYTTRRRKWAEWRRCSWRTSPSRRSRPRS